MASRLHVATGVVACRPMPNMHIRDIPDDVAEWLRERAARNDRSVAGEIRSILARVKAADDAKR